MPTGYTHKIKDGQSFNDFVLGCARAFGACIMMRDDPQDAPIPERFEPSDYHVKELAKAKEQLIILSQLTAEDAEQKARYEYQAELARYNERVLENNNQNAMYAAMLERVKSWGAPATHVGFKKFMIEQIESSMRFDDYAPDPPKQLSGKAWASKEEAKVLRDISYHQSENAKEIERTEGRNKWIKDLRDSLRPKEPV
jgi:hypothetical protein